MAVRVDVAPALIAWATERSGRPSGGAGEALSGPARSRQPSTKRVQISGTERHWLTYPRLGRQHDLVLAELVIGSAHPPGDADLRLREGNETATSDLRHSCARVPEWLHIGAYPHVFPKGSHLRSHCETPATEAIRYWPKSKTGLIAMQKVEGSNPFSRFFGNALHVGGSVPVLKPETKWNHPRISRD
jgi:hypothetical protein